MFFSPHNFQNSFYIVVGIKFLLDAVRVGGLFKAFGGATLPTQPSPSEAAGCVDLQALTVTFSASAARVYGCINVLALPGDPVPTVNYLCLSTPVAVPKIGKSNVCVARKIRKHSLFNIRDSAMSKLL